MNKKVLKFGFFLVVIVFLGWYLFIKKSDYTINFKVKTATGTVYQGIQEWASIQTKSQNEKFVVLEKSKFSYIQQEMTKGKDVYQYSWDITSVNDSITEISVSINEKNASIYNRLTAPFFNTKFKEEQIKKITDFRDALNLHLSNFKVKIDGKGSSEETFVAYISLKSSQQEKAQTMIMNDNKITGFLHNKSIKITGTPYLEIVNWDKENEKVAFNYCFPIDKNSKIVADTLVKFKTIPAQKGLLATYFGNYRTSDRAWFSLLDYAKKNNLKLSNQPLEHFFANPFNGGDEKKWKTIVLIPFSK